MTEANTTLTDTFVAVDVETANPDFASICQIGLVKFADGAIVEEWQSLVNPEDDFDSLNVSIHGITEASVAAAPTLPALYGALTHRLNGGLAVCHTAFDRVAIGRSCDRYGL